MSELQLINAEYAKDYIKPRDENAHKGNFGRILVIAGSYGMAGAAVMCTRAALKSGAGLVTCAVADELFNILQISVPEAMCTARENLLERDKLEFLRKFDAVAFGPGIGVSYENWQLLKHILANTSCGVVIDADGINTLCRYDENFAFLKAHECRVVLTPHPGEAGRILSSAKLETYGSYTRRKVVRELADFAKSVVLLKGNKTLVTKPDDLISCNMSGNPGMATGGSGDVLTGVIASLIGGGMDLCLAARVGAFVHGLAGDIACEKCGQWGMTAVDILDCLPQAFKELAGK